MPDTTPPVATSASLSYNTSIPENSGLAVVLTVNVADAVAPVDEVSATVFNSAGSIVADGFSGESATTVNGPVEFTIPDSANLPPDTYTVAFQITDAGGLTSSYGYPTSPPVPGGPLQFTVTPQRRTAAGRAVPAAGPPSGLRGTAAAARRRDAARAAR